MGEQNDDSVDELLDGFGFDDRDEAWLTRFRDAAPRPDEQAATTAGWIGPYEILDEIGRGGQGVVYRARQPGTGRLVALKRVRAGVLASESARLRFRREVEAAAGLSDPGLVSVFAVEEIECVPVLIMELVEGEPFDQWAAGRHSSEIVSVAIELCDAVHHAHQRGILHCDLKPSNVLVEEQSSRSRPRVLDFGLVRWLQECETTDRSEGAVSSFAGTPMWAAPEQAHAVRALDVRTDEHAIGILLFHALTGQMPRPETDSVEETLNDLRSTAPTDLVSLLPSADPALAAIIMQALQPDPEARYSSVAAMGDDLRRYLGDEPVRAYSGSAPYQLRLLIRRHRVASGLVGASGIALVAFMILLTHQRNQAVSARKTAEQVTAFVQETLAATGPEGLGSAFSLDTLLADAAARADRDLTLAPAAAGEIHATLGAIQTARWDWTAAENHYARAVELADDVDPPGRTPRDELMTGWGRALASLRRPEAIDVLDEALSRRIARLGADHVDVSICRMRLGYAFYMALDPPQWEDAERELLAALAGFERAGALDHRDRAACLHILGYMRIRQRRRDDAYNCYHEALSILRQRNDETDPHYGELLFGHVALLDRMKKYDELAAMSDEICRVLERAHEISKLGSVYEFIATARRETGDPDGAVRMIHEAMHAKLSRLRLDPDLDALRLDALDRELTGLPEDSVEALPHQRWLDESALGPAALSRSFDWLLLEVAGLHRQQGRRGVANDILDAILARRQDEPGPLARAARSARSEPDQ